MKERITVLDHINKFLAEERVDLPGQESYPPSVETIGIALEIPPGVIHSWAKNDKEFREGLKNMQEVDGADVALLLMETKKRYST